MIEIPTRKTAQAPVSRLRMRLLGLMAVVAVLGHTPGHAQQTDNDHVIDVAGQQHMLLEKMTKESLLIALKVEPQRHMKELRASHEKFRRILAGLRNGDTVLGLPPVGKEETLDRISSVEGLWPMFDDTIRMGLDSGTIGREVIDTLAELDKPLSEAITGAVNAYVAEAAAGQLHSMLSNSLSLSGRQRMLSQKMTKEFLLVAYNHEPRRNKARLKASAKLFRQSLEALLLGDSQQQIVAPPTLEIETQLAKVAQLWRQFQPLTEAASRGRKPTADDIMRVSELSAKLLEALEGTLSLYAAL